MTTHELKLDIKYFDDVKSGKKNFEIRKNDRDFQVGDILKLKAYGKPDYFTEKEEPSYLYTGNVLPWLSCVESVADTITAKVTSIIFAEDWNSDEDLGYPSFAIDENGKINLDKVVLVGKILNEYFHKDRLPDDYVVLGIELDDLTED